MARAQTAIELIIIGRIRSEGGNKRVSGMYGFITLVIPSGAHFTVSSSA